MFDFAVPCLLGLEASIAKELKQFGALNVIAENGRVLFSGDEHILVRANLCSRYSERILLLIGSFEAHSFDELFEGTKSLDWERWIGINDKFPVKGYSLNSDLFSVSDCQAIIKKAVVEKLKKKYHVSWFEESGSLYQIQFSIMKNTVSLYIDTSGVGLHKRGYRTEANLAPLKETLAASLCYFSHLHDNHTLYDPMCGSGTILIEGALMAKNIAPGIRRSFVSESWQNISKDVWKNERELARTAIKQNVDFFAYGSDIDSKALETAKRNAIRAGVSDLIEFSCCDVSRFEPKSEKGTLITNPPYGERLFDKEYVVKLYKILGEKMPVKNGWSYGIITSDDDFESLFGRKADKRRKLYNGMKRCQFYMYFKNTNR